MKPIRIGTRGSKLALWQAGHVAELIRQKNPRRTIEIITIKTTGDKVWDVSLSEIFNKSLFLKEIEDELLASRIDLAVHSMKDVPAEMPENLEIAAILGREDPRDAFVSRKYSSFESLPAGSIVGTSSLRRTAQLKARRSGLVYRPIRGNVDTRLKKLDEGGCGAIIVAAAGLIRLGLASAITQYLEIIPAVGQGAIGIEIRTNDPVTQKMITALDDEPTSHCVRAERAFLKRIGGDCRVPVGCFGVLREGQIHLKAFVSDVVGTASVFREAVSEKTHARETAIQLADEILANGGDEIMKGF